jgi:hypothetical protein
MGFWKKIQDRLERLPTEREPRLRVHDQDKISFFIEGRENKLKIENISSGGIAIPRAEISTAQLDQTILGEILVSEEKHAFPVEAKVVHLSSHTIGMSFDLKTKELAGALSQYFRAEMLGARLRLVDKKYLKTPQNGEPLWLTDGHENELYVVFNEAGILSFHMSFLGHYVEGSLNKRTLVGQLAAKTQDRKQNMQSESDLIIFNDDAREETLMLAREYVMNAAGIPAVRLEQLLKFL